MARSSILLIAAVAALVLLSATEPSARLLFPAGEVEVDDRYHLARRVPSGPSLPPPHPWRPDSSRNNATPFNSTPWPPPERAKSSFPSFGH
ncbi:hypothetical protein KFK09_003246 [Dendrobium nobile]|uniref:Uncharacterized protein n=1 Tax=Dendrobium nobile TaxID=94219 RepID=A0A8T3C3N0_DENNO|nr:hypothetical protein KFK09_003246 [Dendrobium nobile]